MEFGRTEDPRRRLAGVAGVVVFHALLVYGLVNGLARKAIEILPAPIETKILKEVKEDVPPPPPPPPPTFETPPPPVIPPPEISIASAPAPTNAIHATTNARPAVSARTAPVVKAKNCREPEYPSISQRLNETGSVVLQLLVGPDGRVSDSKIEKSSGYPRLDEAARRALSLCKFTPGTENGVAAPMWAQLKYTFRQQ